MRFHIDTEPDPADAEFNLDLLAALPYSSLSDADAELHLDLLGALPYPTLLDADTIMDRITQLPTELSNMIMIMTALWESAFCPGVVHLPQRPKKGQSALDYYMTSPSPARPSLLALSKGIQADCEARFWTDNTFVIGLRELPEELQWYVHNVRPPKLRGEKMKIGIVYSIKELGTVWANYLPPDHPNRCPEAFDGYVKYWDEQLGQWYPTPDSPFCDASRYRDCEVLIDDGRRDWLDREYIYRRQDTDDYYQDEDYRDYTTRDRPPSWLLRDELLRGVQNEEEIASATVERKNVEEEFLRYKST